ncbi:addiction module protein [Granulicella sibirica]|uniref:Addiction module component, TIGR02574 family n=1 Tax=Granulicella sibirica TaxID=2479048 RepID=A0A4Q0T1R3_9BACT|nr:addiction module protein [Granulicella sibirica]RXH57523.1 hypothetical protein GRAN_0833 [Granulicella sibirica]
MTNLPSQISSLSVAEKFDLLDALWENIEAHPPDLTDEQSSELDRRMASYAQDSSAVIPWEQVRADLFKK